MPFWSGGYLYVDSGIFSGTGRENLGISQLLNSDQNRLILYSGDRSLTFDLEKDTVRDNDGQAYYPGAIRRGGRVFVPAYTVSSRFQITQSIIDVKRGSLVWLRPSGYGLSEEVFADAAEYSMESTYRNYLRDKERADASASTEEPPAVPENPGGAVSEPLETELNGKRIYLCIAGVSSTLLDVLDTYGAQAAFFLTPAQMAESGDLLRRMTATGQSVGILADGSDPEHTVEEQLKAGNQALAQAACCKTRFALIQKAVGRSVETAQDMGFCCLRPDLDRSGRTLQGPEGAESLLERITSRRGDVTVWLGEGVTSQGLRSFLIAVRKADGVCVALRETAVE